MRTRPAFAWQAAKADSHMRRVEFLGNPRLALLPGITHKHDKVCLYTTMCVLNAAECVLLNTIESCSSKLLFAKVLDSKFESVLLDIDKTYASGSRV